MAKFSAYSTAEERIVIDLNTCVVVQERIQAGRVGWSWPLIMAFIRFPLALLGAVLTFLFFTLQGNPHAFALSFVTSTFYFTFVNLISLVLLIWLARREGLRLRDLIGFKHDRFGKDVLLGLLWVLVLYIPFTIGVLLVPFLFYGGDAFNHYAQIFSVADTGFSLPLWFALWAAFVFPTLNAPIEEMHYRGYAQIRLSALSNKTWVGILVPTVGFALQHVVFAPTVVGAIVYLVSFFCWGMGAALIYQRQKRLPSLIIAHFITNLFFGLVPLASIFWH